MSFHSSRGTTFVELLVAVGLVSLLFGLAVPLLMTGREEQRLWGAAAFLRSRIMLARAEAAHRGAAVGLSFRRHADTFVFRSYVDGNGNGIRSRDIARAIDVALSEEIDIGDRFPGVTFALSPATPVVGGRQRGGNPVRLGGSVILTVTTFGTSTSGTLYLRSPRGHQAAVRVLGATTRVQVYGFDVNTTQWRLR